MKIVSVVGARPHFPKLAPMVRSCPDGVKHIIIHTGQHYDYNMSRVFFDDLNLPDPDLHLNTEPGSHASQTAHIMLELEKAFLKIKPDWVLVYGDTNTTLAAALVAAKLNIKLMHIEAGIRNFDLSVPEEVNRVTCDHISLVNACPTNTAAHQLKAEGVGERSFNTGDLMYDIFKACSMLVSARIVRLKETYGEDFTLVTLHRPSNVDDPSNLRKILKHISALNPILVAHPRTKAVLDKIHVPKSVRVVEPVGYLDMLTMLHLAARVITDSGGLQREAYWSHKPCLTVFPSTCWPETLRSGANRLTSIDTLEDDIKAFLSVSPKYHCEVFGQGQAASKIWALIGGDYVE